MRNCWRDSGYIAYLVPRQICLLNQKVIVDMDNCCRCFFPVKKCLLLGLLLAVFVSCIDSGKAGNTPAMNKWNGIDSVARLADSEDRAVVMSVDSTGSVEIDRSVIDLGKFYWKEEQFARVRIKNTGEKPLVVTKVKTSCGCTYVDYDKSPAEPGKSIRFGIIYKAENHGYVNKTVAVYCNYDKSPIVLRLKGEGVSEGSY